GVGRVELRDGKRPLCRRRCPRGEVKALDIATPALLRVQGEGRTFLALWRDQHLWDLNPLTLDALLRLPLDGIRTGLSSIIGTDSRCSLERARRGRRVRVRQRHELAEHRR